MKAYNTLNNYGGIIAAGGSGGSTSYPKLFVNILLFDKDYNFLDAAWEQIDGGEQIGATPKTAHDLMSKEVTVKEAGYAYVYVSNENPTLVEFYVDDVVITHTPTNVTQYNEYYPFGLQTSASWTRESTKDNNYLYNAANELNKTNGWYEMFYRGYDPAIGRMLQVDPYATMYASTTTYNYALNNPVMMNDPSGGYVYANAAADRINKINDRNNPNYFTDWAESFRTEGMQMRYDADQVNSGGMSMGDYLSKYAVSIDRKDFGVALDAAINGFFNGKVSVEGMFMIMGYKVNEAAGELTAAERAKYDIRLPYAPGTALTPIRVSVASLAFAGAERKIMKDVADIINMGGLAMFLHFLISPGYGPEFFTKSINNGPETRGSGSAPKAIAFALKTAAWGHRYFGENDQLRHIIGTFMVAENFGPVAASNITTANEIYGLLIFDVPNWVQGRSSSAFEIHDYVNNQIGVMLWMSYALSVKMNGK